MKTTVKTATIPSLRVNEEVCAAAEARHTGIYVSADEVMAGLDKTLASERKKTAR